jgi:phosphorylase/glycogen(starch) synthase
VREADVFATVSPITAGEAELLHGRRPDPMLPIGIDLHVIDEIAGPSVRSDVRERLVREASLFLGEDVSDAALVCISGRYEFHNKGLDVLLEACGRVNGQEGRRVVLFVLVPAGNSGLRSEVLERREKEVSEVEGAVGISTHNLFDEDDDPVHVHCWRFGLENRAEDRVKVIQVPIYLGLKDGFLNEPYEAVLRAMDLSCFPSYYEPWGYTPQESLAVGVPTVTSDYAGFGQWALAEGLGEDAGVTVLPRDGRAHVTVVEDLAGVLEGHVRADPARTTPIVDPDTCRETAVRTSWGDLFDNYEKAYEKALDLVQERADAGVSQARRPKQTIAIGEKMGATPRLTYFDVSAALPDALKPLQRISRNFWWCWDREAPSLFEELAPEVWESCRHNPVALLEQAPRAALDDKAADSDYVARVRRVDKRFQAYLGGARQVHLANGGGDDGGELSVEHPVAYFSAEFGLHESLRIYGGGLGILAGDHLKSASDLGLPLVGIGLFYRMGYVQQRLTAAGEQTQVDRENDPHLLPLECVRTAEGAPLEVQLQLPGRTLHLRAWRTRVGRVSLYLLDANSPSNLEEDRDITRNLYGGDEEARLLQELVLGRGGERLLRRLGVRPAVYHINEGHAAFLMLERVARLVGEEGLTFEAAREHVRSTSAFTTHTPVPAGHDRFDETLMRRYFSDAEAWVGVPWDRFYDLGRAEDGTFNMTYLALSFASEVNGVSKLHGVASRALLDPYWPGLLEDEVPVKTVTNGVHLPTWTHPSLQEALGADPDRPLAGKDVRVGAGRIAPDVLWRTRGVLKRRLLDVAKTSLAQSFLERNDSPLLLHRMLEGLDENALVIGFARRFAPYKRAHLLFQDVERLERLLASKDRPVRILIAGKAHPRDQRGLDILRDIASRTRGDDLVGKVIFLENYDMGVARALVQGVDVWLNTPTRMLEASGTSGMKASANGGLNLSIADGWWSEAYDGENGWVIGGERVYEDQALQDQFDSASLYRLLEEEVVPLYFDRNASGVPEAWVARMIDVLETIPPVFNTNRMVEEYFDQAYRKLGLAYFRSVRDKRARAKARAQEGQRIRRGFAGIRVLEAHIADLNEIQVGESIDVRLDLDLGALAPDDVRVELVLGRAASDGLREVGAVPLDQVDSDEDLPDGAVRFEASHRMEGSGHYAHGLRIRARHDEQAGGPLRDLVSWI